MCFLRGAFSRWRSSSSHLVFLPRLLCHHPGGSSGKKTINSLFHENDLLHIVNIVSPKRNYSEVFPTYLSSLWTCFSLYLKCIILNIKKKYSVKQRYCYLAAQSSGVHPILSANSTSAPAAKSTLAIKIAATDCNLNHGRRQ